MRLRQGCPFFLQAFKMKFDGLLDELKHLFLGFCRSDTAGKIGYISTETMRAFLDNNHVTHMSFSPKSRLLQHAVESAGRDINAGLS